MRELTPIECRVLGVLVEKALATPQHYPLTLNSLMAGANQKNNRAPVMQLDADAILDALDGLRAVGMAREVMLSGSRVSKFRHTARDVLGITVPELAILVELLLRGPQTLGELRGRASRMTEVGDLETVQASLTGMMEQEVPLVKRLSPAPGSRAERFAQLLAGDVADVAPPPPAETPAPGGDLGERVEKLEKLVGALFARIDEVESRLSAFRGDKH